MDSIRKFYGVIFIRPGGSIYANGVFKFTLTLPTLYNGNDTWPSLVFTTPVYNPHVHPETGELDLKYEYTTWDPHRHYLVTVLTYLKKIFYIDFTQIDGDYLSTEQPQDLNYINQDAITLAKTDFKAFRTQVDKCVTSSQQEIIDGKHTDCTIVFNEHSACHQILLDLLQRDLGGDDPNAITKTTKEILEFVETANISASEHDH